MCSSDKHEEVAIGAAGRTACSPCAALAVMRISYRCQFNNSHNVSQLCVQRCSSSGVALLGSITPKLQVRDEQ